MLNMKCYSLSFYITHTYTHTYIYIYIYHMSFVSVHENGLSDVCGPLGITQTTHESNARERERERERERVGESERESVRE